MSLDWHDLFIPMQSIVGDAGAKAFEETITNADKPVSGTIASALHIITLLFGASGVFRQIQQSTSSAIS